MGSNTPASIFAVFAPLVKIFETGVSCRATHLSGNTYLASSSINLLIVISNAELFDICLVFVQMFTRMVDCLTRSEDSVLCMAGVTCWVPCNLTHSLP